MQNYRVAVFRNIRNANPNFSLLVQSVNKIHE
nr:MAG TPA: hypothetical protein [Caudoviricetes sp.]